MDAQQGTEIPINAIPTMTSISTAMLPRYGD